MSRKLITEEKYHEYYQTYISQYYRSQTFIESRGGRSRDMEYLTYTEFKTDFDSELTDYENMSPKAISLMMAKHDAYSLTWKRAKALSEAHIKRYGGELTPKLIIDYRAQAMMPKDQDGQPLNVTIIRDIKARRSQLFEEGHDSEYVRLKISQEFFGSP